MLNLIEKLCNTDGVSGDEGRVRNLILKEMKKYVNKCSVDKMGNLICYKKGKGDSVMITAHMDEVGLMVNNIDENGHIHFSLVGGIEEQTLIAQRLRILTKKGVIKGVITHKELHMDFIENPYKLPDYTRMYVDTGLTKQELVKKGVRTGNYMVPDEILTTLGDNRIISGKGLDNRIGCAIVIEIAKRMKSHNRSVYYVFTVQEEVGLYGARTSIYNINPTWAITVETAPCTDFLYQRGSKKGLNKGTVITLKDAQFIANKCLSDTMIDVAKKKRIPYQLEVSDIGTTDALSISLSKGGIPTAVLSVPVRNIHSTISVAHMNDVEDTARLIHEVMKKPPAKCI